MQRCTKCNKRIAVGGKALGSEHYCSDRCLKQGLLQASREFLGEELIFERIESIHQGPCPKCGGHGPVDMQTHYTVWSAIILTSYKDVPEICCKRCGIQKKIGGLFFSGFLGWWGIPFGIVITPIQVIRNLVALFQAPSSKKVSKALDEMVRMELGARTLLEKQSIEAEKTIGPPELPNRPRS
ncbi:hypothetical protein [Coraliomargarita parva]|uniref:hypothetical protein n=1 Tax=Coraliomargarita parva TaxID=3014050 RepID=UPI0022B46222|nr:hypothetical protein [Coraliomargarita parva]